MITMITVKPFPSEKIPEPMPVMLGTSWIQMIEMADFVPDKPAVVPMPKAESGDKPVELHQPAAPLVPHPPVMRTKITMHNGAPLWVQDTMAEIKAMMV
jgi:hypothetical protein